MEAQIGGKSLWQDALILTVDTTGRKRGKPTPDAITMTPGPPPVNVMIIMRRKKKMPKFEVVLRDSVCYCSIEADTKQEAIEKALGWWLERVPEIVSATKEED